MLKTILYEPRWSLMQKITPWSSARAHVRGVKDPLLSSCPVSVFIGDWKIFLRQNDPEGILDDIRRRNRAGLPMGEDAFIKELATELGKSLQDLLPREAGRPRK